MRLLAASFELLAFSSCFGLVAGVAFRMAPSRRKGDFGRMAKKRRSELLEPGAFGPLQSPASEECLSLKQAAKQGSGVVMVAAVSGTARCKGPLADGPRVYMDELTFGVIAYATGA